MSRLPEPIALAEKRQAQAGETAANEAKDIIAKAKAEVEQMKRREEYFSAIAQAARHIQDRHFEIAETRRELLTFYGGESLSLGFSPDGMRVLITVYDKDARIYDAVDWRLSPEALEKAQVENYQKWLQENMPAKTP
jgi:hypothetical protein